MQRRVLIIEDEKLIILSTQMVLEASGFRVDSAMDGEEGIKKARESAPDLILLDIMMPGIDGWETLTRLKQDPQTADVPVVIFTAREHSRGHQRSAAMKFWSAKNMRAGDVEHEVSLLREYHLDVHLS